MTETNWQNCEAIVRRLWPHLDGRLPESDRERVTKHLELCNDCRSHFDFAKAFLDAVHAASPNEQTSEDLRQRVIVALTKEGFAVEK